MKKKQIFVLGLIGLMLITGLILAGCDLFGEECKGDGECEVTIAQGKTGMFIDQDASQHSCGVTKHYDSDGKEKSGCNVANIQGWYGSDYYKIGKQTCNCKR